MYILVFFFTAVAALFLSSQTLLYLRLYGAEPLMAAVEAACAQASSVDRHECIRQALRSQLSSKFVAASLAAIFILVNLFYRFITINKTNLITTYYMQSVKSIRRFLDDTKYFDLERRYAMMTCKEDYDSIIAEIASVAEMHSTALPKRYA